MQVLSELSAKLLSLLPEDYRQKVKYFVSDYQQVADQLRSLIYRTMCPVLIDQTNVSDEIAPCRYHSLRHDLTPFHFNMNALHCDFV